MELKDILAKKSLILLTLNFTGLSLMILNMDSVSIEFKNWIGYIIAYGYLLGLFMAIIIPQINFLLVPALGGYIYIGINFLQNKNILYNKGFFTIKRIWQKEELYVLLEEKLRGTTVKFSPDLKKKIIASCKTPDELDLLFDQHNYDYSWIYNSLPHLFQGHPWIASSAVLLTGALGYHLFSSWGIYEELIQIWKKLYYLNKNLKDIHELSSTYQNALFVLNKPELLHFLITLTTLLEGPRGLNIYADLTQNLQKGEPLGSFTPEGIKTFNQKLDNATTLIQAAHNNGITDPIALAVSGTSSNELMTTNLSQNVPTRLRPPTVFTGVSTMTFRPKPNS